MSLLPVAGALNALTPMNAIASVALIAGRQNAHALTHPLPKNLQNGKWKNYKMQMEKLQKEKN